MIRSENLLDEMQCSMDYWMLVWEFIFVPLHLVSFILKSVELLIIITITLQGRNASIIKVRDSLKGKKIIFFTTILSISFYLKYHK